MINFEDKCLKNTKKGSIKMIVAKIRSGLSIPELNLFIEELKSLAYLQIK